MRCWQARRSNPAPEAVKKLLFTGDNRALALALSGSRATSSTNKQPIPADPLQMLSTQV